MNGLLMRIYILRHGNAENPAHRKNDEDRELTDEGHEEVSAVARRARHAKVDPDLVISSPYIRAVQTAEIAAKDLEYSEQIARSRVLEPDSDPQSVWEEIRTHTNIAQLLLVGHEPLLSRTVAHLLGCPSLVVKMATGTMVSLDAEDLGRQPHATLRWMLTPKLARGNHG
jgi:phosphohistidine phosphatase